MFTWELYCPRLAVGVGVVCAAHCCLAYIAINEISCKDLKLGNKIIIYIFISWRFYINKVKREIPFPLDRSASIGSQETLAFHQLWAWPP